jgi:hypothetical protein
MANSMFEATRRKRIFAPKNELDKCTVASIYPRQIIVRNHTIFPGLFVVPAGSVEHPGLLVVESSSWFKTDYNTNDDTEVVVGSPSIARSIIDDYARGLPNYNGAESMPGLFFVTGERDEDYILEHCQKQIADAERKQNNWYMSLVRQADTLWARANGNPLAISDDARLAAELLGLKDKAWMQDFKTLELTNCPACGTPRNTNFPMCANCKTIIDKDKFASLGLSVAS